MDLDELARDIKRWGNELGFQHVAITDASPGAHNDHLERWLERGFHGEMEYMSRHLALRREPSR
ncbi:MAG: tRNA epoxyqueuosine(34) reductase QueG, partial [Gammaproteobacteria bacterium]